MKQSLSFVTIGVNDLEKMKQFYTDCFGWKPLKDDGGIIFFKLNGFILGLYPNHELAEDAGLKASTKSEFKGFTFAINFSSEKEVDQVVENLKNKGAMIVKSPEKVFWGGYRGYIKDIENNLWEIAYNPFLELDKEGNVVSHK